MQPLDADLTCPGLKGGAQPGIRFDLGRDPIFNHRAHVLAGAAYQEGQSAAGLYFCNELARLSLENCQAPAFIWGGNVDEVMGYTQAFGVRRFRRADVHAAIEKPGISRDDLAAKALSQFDGYLCFSGAGWAEQDDQGLQGIINHIYSLSTYSVFEVGDHRWLVRFKALDGDHIDAPVAFQLGIFLDKV
jgi:hypothetical protein